MERRKLNNDRNQFVDKVKRARRREKESIYLYLCIYIYIYIFKNERIEEERERKRVKPNLSAFRLKILFLSSEINDNNPCYLIENVFSFIYKKKLSFYRLFLSHKTQTYTIQCASLSV